MTEEKRVSRVLGLNDMISGPLLAFIDAEVAATLKYVDFIRNFFDGKDSRGKDITDAYKFGQLRTVSFRYQRHGAHTVEEVEMHVPLLSLVPLPVLELVEAKFEFGLHIIAAEENRSASSNGPQSGMQRAIAAGEPESQPSQHLKLHTMLAPQRNGSSVDGRAPHNETNMQVSLHVKHGDLPSGLSAIFTRMSEATYSQTAPPDPEETDAPEQDGLKDVFYWTNKDESFTVKTNVFTTLKAGYDGEQVTEFKALSSDRQIFTVSDFEPHLDGKGVDIKVAGQSEGSAELIIMLKTAKQKFCVAKTINVTRGPGGGDGELDAPPPSEPEL